MRMVAININASHYRWVIYIHAIDGISGLRGSNLLLACHFIGSVPDEVALLLISQVVCVVIRYATVGASAVAAIAVVVVVVGAGLIGVVVVCVGSARIGCGLLIESERCIELQAEIFLLELFVDSLKICNVLNSSAQHG